MTKNQKAQSILTVFYDSNITYSTHKPHTITFFYKNHEFDIYITGVINDRFKLASKIIEAGYYHKKAEKIIESYNSIENEIKTKNEKFRQDANDFLYSDQHKFFILKLLYSKIFNYNYNGDNFFILKKIILNIYHINDNIIKKVYSEDDFFMFKLIFKNEIC